MTPDERWEFLRHNIESLHASVQELSAAIHEDRLATRERLDRLDSREREGRRAAIRGIAAYLETLEGGAE